MRPLLVVLISVLKWPLFGALLAVGAIAVSQRVGPDIARDLGSQAGEGFAEGVVRFNRALEAGGVTVSGGGRWTGRYT